jgi:O-antigen ligase
MRILLASIYPYAFLLLYLIIPFDEYIRALPNILLGILVVVFPLIVRKEDFRKLVKKPTLLLLGFFIFLVLISLLNGRLEEDFNILKKILIAVGLVLLYIPVQDFNKIDKAIMVSALAAMIFSLINVFLVNDISSFEITNPIDILLVDRLYLGLLSVLSILISYKSIRLGFHPNNQFYLVNIILNIGFIFIIGSKVALGILCVLLLLRQFYGPKKKFRVLVSIGVLALVSIISLSTNDNLIEKYIYGSESDLEAKYHEPSLHMDFRTIIWNCACDMAISEGSNIFGIGFKKTNKNLAACYDQTIEDSKTKVWFKENGFNTHNQFIDFYLSSGLIAFVLFIGIFLTLLIQYRKQFFPVALIVTILLFGMTESFFHRQIGAYYFGFVMIVLLSNNTLLQRSPENAVET